jgi:proline iminopeptidase
VADLEALRRQAGVGAWVLFGGSWGATLALAYAQAHPTRAAGLILRGLTLMRRRDVDWFYRGGGADLLYPGSWRRFLEHLPPGERGGDPVAAYYRRLTAPDADVRAAAARAWAGLEMAVGFGGRVDSVQVWDGSQWAHQPAFSDQSGAAAPPHAPPASTNAGAPATAPAAAAAPSGEAAWAPALERFAGGADVPASQAQAILTCHYCHHDSFLEEDQLLAGAPALAKIPTIAVHGRLDHVCPAATAHDLHRALPSMELRVVPGAGHSMYEEATVHELVWAGERMHAALAGAGAPPGGAPAAAEPEGALT